MDTKPKKDENMDISEVKEEIVINGEIKMEEEEDEQFSSEGVDLMDQVVKWRRLLTLGSLEHFYKSQSFNNADTITIDFLKDNNAVVREKVLAEGRGFISSAMTNEVHKHILTKKLLPDVLPLLRQWNYDPPSKSVYYWLLATMWRYCDNSQMKSFITKVVGELVVLEQLPEAMLVFARLFNASPRDTQSGGIQVDGDRLTKTHPFSTAFKSLASNYYSRPDCISVFNSVIKYGSQTTNRKPKGFDHHNIIKLIHNPFMKNEGTKCIIVYLLKSVDGAQLKFGESTDPVIKELLTRMDTLRRITKSRDVVEVAGLIDQNKDWINKSNIPTPFFREPAVVSVLVQFIPLRQLLYWITGLTVSGFLNEQSPEPATKKPKMSSGERPSFHIDTTVDLIRKNVTKRLTSDTELEESGIQPAQLLRVARTYESEGGQIAKANFGCKKRRVSLRFSHDPVISDALWKMYHKSFQNMMGSGKHLLYCVDVRSSVMSGVLVGQRLSGFDVSACLLLGAKNVEIEPVSFMAWSLAENGKEVIELDKDKMITHETTVALLENVIQNTHVTVEYPILFAIEQNKPVDGFVLVTNRFKESAEKMNFISNALEKYNAKMNRKAKVVVLLLHEHEYNRAFGEQSGNILTILGFDRFVPEIIRRFMKGDI